LITAIGEINPKKFGKVTPGSKIPIVNQKEILNSDRMDNSKVLAITRFRSSPRIFELADAAIRSIAKAIAARRIKIRASEITAVLFSRKVSRD
jgi:hypothetical protein